MQSSKWNQADGYHPHKTPSGAFDPEVFALPEFERMDLNLATIAEGDKVIMGRTESLGLKCLADRPLLIPQVSTDSVFSRVEGETMEAAELDSAELRHELLDPGYGNGPASTPIGIRARATPTEQGEEMGAKSGEVETRMDLITEPFSMTSLPDRLACEETANAMTNAVLQDDECQEQIQANNLFQMVNGGAIMLFPSTLTPMYHQLNAAQVANAQMNVLYKTELCRSWQFGTCRYAERCLFAHGEQELRPLCRPRHNKYKTELCITFHSFGFCPYAARCNFVHEMDEHRPAKHSVPSLYKTRLCRTFMERGNCPYGDKCDFAHGTKDLSYDITKHPKYRTKICRSFQETGSCIYGDRCCFSHTLPQEEEKTPAPAPHAPAPAPPEADTLQPKQNSETTDETLIDSEHLEANKNKNQICRRWKFTGKCPFGSHCIFSHAAEKRNTQRG